MPEPAPRIGLLWRAEWDPPGAAQPRLHGMFAAFAALGIDAEPVVYSDDRADALREQLLALDGVLVWVNPVEQGLDRSRLDPLLREAAAAGVWVSAHPDVILRMATKRVLVDTASMSWSAETHLYRTVAELGEQLPRRLASGPVVLKQQRGMGGEGVWKVALDPGRRARPARGERRCAVAEPLDPFIDRCRPYFADGGLMVEQPFQPRLAEGMIRVYLCRERGGRLRAPVPAGAPRSRARCDATGREGLQAAERAYEPLRRQMESRWVPELQAIVGVERERLPAIWDADFLLGRETTAVRPVRDQRELDVLVPRARDARRRAGGASGALGGADGSALERLGQLGEIPAVGVGDLRDPPRAAWGGGLRDGGHPLTNGGACRTNWAVRGGVEHEVGEVRRVRSACRSSR